MCVFSLCGGQEEVRKENVNRAPGSGASSGEGARDAAGGSECLFIWVASVFARNQDRGRWGNSAGTFKFPKSAQKWKFRGGAERLAIGLASGFP